MLLGSTELAKVEAVLVTAVERALPSLAKARELMARAKLVTFAFNEHAAHGAATS
jgi:hypothetical protein